MTPWTYVKYEAEALLHDQLTLGQYLCRFRIRWLGMLRVSAETSTMIHDLI